MCHSVSKCIFSHSNQWFGETESRTNHDYMGSKDLVERN